ncbi:MAG: RNA polymerase sigma factor [Pseudomonadota bacterium]
MTETSWATLREHLAAKYDDLRKVLIRRLGSDDLARETLHETWLHLDRTDGIGAMRSPNAYLLRVALNLATDRGRSEHRRLRRFEVKAIIESIADAAPGPAREVEARQELAALRIAIAKLPERQRAILIAARVEQVPHQKIAERFGISRRMVLIELKRALAECEACLEQK